MPLLEIKINLEAGQFKTEAAGVENVAGNAEVGLDSLASKATAVSFAFNQVTDTIGRVADVLAVPIGRFADLQDSMANVGSLGVDNIARMQDQVLDMAGSLSVPLDDISSGLYEVVSAGVDAANQIDVLESSAKAAKAGVAETTEALQLGAAVVKGYGLDWSEIDSVFDKAFQTVKLGQTNFRDLANNMGSVIPLAAALKIENEELFGSYATLTGVTGNTSEVSTQLRAIMQGLAAPTKELSALIEAQTGKTVEQAAASEGLAGILKILAEDTGGSASAMTKYFGSVEAVNAALALSTSQYNTFLDKTQQMTDSAGAMTAAFDVQSETIRSQVQLLENRWDAAMIRAVEVGVPLINSFFDLAEEITRAGTAASRMSDELQNISDQFARLREVDSLIDRYSNLSEKTSLSAAEHKELSEIIQALSAQYPGAITEVDEYGNAVGISADKVKLLVEQKRALLRAQEQDVLSDAMGKLADQLNLTINAQEELNKAQESGTRRMGRFAVETADSSDAVRHIQQVLKDNQAELSENITLLSNFFDFDADRSKLATQLGLNEEQVDALIEKWNGLNAAVKNLAQPDPVDFANIEYPDEVKESLLPDLDLEYEDFQEYMDKEVEARRKSYEDQIGLGRQYRDNKAELEQESLEFTLSNFASLMAATQGMNEELFFVGKAAAVAETVYNTYASATAAYKAVAGIPVVGPGLAAAAAASAIAAGLANVAKIQSTKFERRAEGGFLGDEIRSILGADFGGGENRLIIANDGEFIVNRTNTARFRNDLERINRGQEPKDSNRPIYVVLKGTMDGQTFLRENYPHYEKDENDRRAF